MLNKFWKSLVVSPALVGAAMALGLPAQAAPAEGNGESVLNQLDTYANEGEIVNVDQVTSVSELRDVQPTEWAFEALKSLVERYGCIVGYPDRTFRGNRALSRWEFAAGLNACMNVMERLIQENVAVLREDIDKLKRLMQEFESELAALGARIDNLEARTAYLEDHQFSTTTKLTGEVIFAPSAIWGTKNTLNNETDNNQAVFQNRVRLQFNTSFSGDDLLVTRLAAGNAERFRSFYPTQNITDPTTGQPLGIVGDYYESPTFTQVQNLSPGGDNNVAVDWLAYYVPIELGKDLRFNTYIAAWGGIWEDFVPTLNPYFDDFTGGKGALSEFSERNPIYNIGGGGGAGASLQLGFLQNVLGPTSISFGYLASTANNPNSNNNVSSTNPVTGQNYAFSDGGNGLFNGSYSALAQINTNLFDFLNLGFTYVNAYTTPDQSIFGKGGFNGVVGTTAANLNRTILNQSLAGGAGVGAPPEGVESYNATANANTADGSFGNQINPFDFGGKQTNSYGIQAAIRPADWISFSAYGSYTNVTLIGKDNGDIWTYGGGIALPDFGKEGNILGIFAGVQPYISGLSNTLGGVYNLPATNPVQVELFYKYQVTDNLSLTPGVIWISKPEQTTNAKDAVIGTLRGTFTF
ncbi:MAG: iron uptake porin [Cyanobacteriota bacterium]|jgi:hypothetical protein